MKNKLYAAAVVAGLVAGSSAYATQIAYASIGMDISFTGGGNFSFLNEANPYGANASFIVPLPGFNYAVGTMSGSYSLAGPIGPATTETTVNGSGNVTIVDPWGGTLSGTLQWVNIAQTGTGNTLNDMALVNLVNVTWTAGTQADPTLAAFQSPPAIDTDTLQFTFDPAETLQQLYAGGVATTYSGTMATVVPDGGMTAMLLGAALSGVGLLRRKLTA